MTLLTSIAIFIVSLLGFVGGVLLSYLAAEEVEPGRKYLLWLGRVLFMVALAVVNYYAWVEGRFIFGGIVTILGIFLLFLEWNMAEPARVFLFPYILLGSAYFLLDNAAAQLVLASVLFLYGLPTGTLMKRI